MQITTDTPDTGAGPADWFTGAVYVDAITAPADDQGNVVTWGEHVTDEQYGGGRPHRSR